MRLYSCVDALPSIDYYRVYEKPDLVESVLERIQAADNRLMALQIGLQEIVYLTGARWGVLLASTPEGNLQPLLEYVDRSKQLYELFEPKMALDKASQEDLLSSVSIDSPGFSAIPLKSFGKIVGAIHLDQMNYGIQDEQKRSAVEIIVPQLALIVEGLLLSQATQDRQASLEIVATANQIGQQLNANPNDQLALAEFLESSRFLFNAEHCFILAVDWDTETLRLLDNYRPDVNDTNLPEISLDDTMLGRVARTDKPFFATKLQVDEQYQDRLMALFGFELQQLMAVPLSIRGEVLGVVGVVNKNRGCFDELDLNLLQMLAPSAALALENAHRFAWEQAEAAQKAELYAVASHALRSPMMNILTSVEWILETGVRNKSHQTLLKDIQAQILNLTKFAGSILDMSRIETENLPTQPAPIALNPLIKKTVAAFEHRFLSHRFEMQAAEQTPPVLADEGQLAIILDHLMENAVKYSPVDSKVRVKLATSGNRVLVSVCDQGGGIPSEEWEDIFDRYYRGRQQPAKEHSLGLGLYIVRKLVNAQGGEIWVESNVGHGSCFTFSLLQAEIGD